MEQNPSNTGTAKLEPTEKLEPSTSEKNCQLESNPYEPAHLFGLLPSIEMVWLISEDSVRLETSIGYDELPEGTYLIFRVSDKLSSEKGLFQVPRPTRTSREVS